MTAIDYYYFPIFVISFTLTLLYVWMWQKHFDVHMTTVFILVPIDCLASYLMRASSDVSAVIVAQKIIYVGTIFLPWLITMCLTSICDIRLSRVVKLGTLFINSLMFSLILTIGNSSLYYKNIVLEDTGSMWIMHKEYGPLHPLFYGFLFSYMVADLVILIYCYKKKNQVSRRILALLVLPIVFTILGYFANQMFSSLGIELTPISALLMQFVYLLIAHRMSLYKVSEMVVESLVESSRIGFISIDNQGYYLGSNETARKILPELNSLRVDSAINKCKNLESTLLSWVKQFHDNPELGKQVYIVPASNGSDDDRFYTVNVDWLYDGRARRGTQVLLEDDTQNQKYIRLLDNYNTSLQKEVAAKTERVEAMHDQLILGLAAMVEGRDNSTGGHIRRTSQGVKILTETMKQDKSLGLTDDFCRNLIKAAPMHDLGKIAVDDAILRKPGRYTKDEFDKMKMHAKEGARIVHEILIDTDDAEFRRIAENVAHYHHERYDGSGYPEGLKGDQIPMEARIMAIADVYDALVSKRVYKDKFSFKEADKIILDGMGSQFDPSLRRYYIKARPRLEAFYESVEQK